MGGAAVSSLSMEARNSLALSLVRRLKSLTGQALNRPDGEARERLVTWLAAGESIDLALRWLAMLDASVDGVGQRSPVGEFQLRKVVQEAGWGSTRGTYGIEGRAN